MEHCSCRYADLIFDHDQICPIQNTQITFDPTKRSIIVWYNHICASIIILLKIKRKAKYCLYNNIFKKNVFTTILLAWLVSLCCPWDFTYLLRMNGFLNEIFHWDTNSVFCCTKFQCLCKNTEADIFVFTERSFEIYWQETERMQWLLCKSVSMALN